MRKALADSRRLIQTSVVAPLSAPTGGWNTADSLATMPPLDAVLMDNFTAEESGVFLRGGDTSFATGMSGAVKMLIEYVSPTDNQLLAASDGNVYNITDGTPVLIKTGFTNAVWQTANFNTFTFFANGSDTVQRYNGITLTDSTFTGVNLFELINVTAVRNRVWFVRIDSGEAYYGPLAGVSGALTLFNIGEVARAGFLVKVDTWSRDAGDGMDDLTVFIMSTGQHLVYTGDPASTFSLVGSYKAPKPIGLRCTTNIGGELIVITEGGYFTMAQIMEGQIGPQDALSSKIRFAVSDAVGDGGSFDGWSVTLTDDNRKLIFNVPKTGSTFNQHVFNTVTKAWGRWLDRETFSITSFLGDLYGGFSGGNVFRLEDGQVDESRASANIKGFAIQAFNTLNTIAPGVKNKQITMIQPFIEGTGNINCTIALLVDYAVKTLTSNLNLLNPGGVAWADLGDTEEWDKWLLRWGDGGGGVSNLTLSAEALGSAFAVALDADTDKTMRWYSTNLTIRPGGIV